MSARQVQYHAWVAQLYQPFASDPYQISPNVCTLMYNLMSPNVSCSVSLWLSVLPFPACTTTQNQTEKYPQLQPMVQAWRDNLS